jgi:hypothetical protein
MLAWAIVIVGSWSAAATLRNGRLLFLIVPALAILAALQDGGAVLCFSCNSERAVSEDLVQALQGTAVGAVIAALVRWRKRATMRTGPAEFTDPEAVP